MIDGAHIVIHSKDPEADRSFFRDVLGFPSVDAGHGWLIFGLPKAEAAFHPDESNDRHEFYLMCVNLREQIAELAAKGVECAPVIEQRWGSVTRLSLPGGGKIGLYEPGHPRP